MTEYDCYGLVMARHPGAVLQVLPAQVQQACPGDHSQLKEGVLLSSGPPEATPHPPPLRLPLLLRRQSLGPLQTSCSASGPYSSTRGRRSLGSRFAAAHLRHRVLVVRHDSMKKQHSSSSSLRARCLTPQAPLTGTMLVGPC